MGLRKGLCPTSDFAGGVDAADEFSGRTDAVPGWLFAWEDAFAVRFWL
jgi:hypothetical protein